MHYFKGRKVTNPPGGAQIIDMITTADVWYDDHDGGDFWPQSPGQGWELFYRRFSENRTTWKRVRPAVDGGAAAVGNVPGGGRAA
jgi:hypothetical protein